MGHDIPDDSEEAVRLGICQYLGLDLNENLLEVKGLPPAAPQDTGPGFGSGPGMGM